MADANVTYSAEFTVALDKLKEGVVETQKTLHKMEEGLKLSGKKAGGDYAENLSKAIEKFIPDSAKKLSGLIENISPKFANAGKQAALGFANALGKLVPAAQPIFTALIASSGGLLLVVGAIAVAIKLVASAIKKAHDEQVAFNKAVKAQKDALDSAKEAIDSINDVSEKTTENYKSGERAAAAQHLVWQKIGEWFSNVFTPIIDGIKNTFETISNAVGFIANKLGLVSDEEVVAAIEAQKLESSYDAINNFSKEYQRTLKQINLDSTKGNKDRLSAAQTYLDRLIEQRVIMAEQVGEGSVQIRNIDDLIARQTRIRDLLIESTAEREKAVEATVEATKEEKSLMTERERLREQTNNAVKDMLLYASSISNEEERQKYIEQQKLSIYDGAKKSMAGLINQFGATRDNARLTYEYWDELVRLTDKENSIITEGEELRKRTNNAIKEMLVYASSITDEEERQKYIEQQKLSIYDGAKKSLAGLISQFGATRDNAKETYEYWDELVELTKELTGIGKLKLEIESADLAYAEKIAAAEFKLKNGLIDETEYAKERQQAADDYNKTLSTLAGKYKEISGAVEMLNENVKEGAAKLFDFEGVAANISQGLGYFQDAASSVLSITQSMADDQIKAIENQLEQQKELIDKQYEEAMETLDKERQAALEAAGFVAAITEEGLEAAMKDAIDSGDEKKIYLEEQRQKELAINKKYDALEKQAEEDKNNALIAKKDDAAREIADIEYRQAMADWTIKLAMAPAQIVSAILEGAAQGGAFAAPVAAAIMGAVGALQLAAIIAAMPKKPALAGGGVIGLPQTYTGGYADGGIVLANTPRGVDAVDAVLANREMVLNDRQQTGLFDMLNAIAAGQTGGGSTTIVVQTFIDGEFVAENTVNHINNGATSPIESRMIR